METSRGHRGVRTTFFTSAPRLRQAVFDGGLTLSIPRNSLLLHLFHCHLWKHFDTFTVNRDLCVRSAGCRKRMSNFENTRKFKHLPLPPKVCPRASLYAPTLHVRACPLAPRPAQSSLVKPGKAKNFYLDVQFVKIRPCNLGSWQFDSAQPPVISS